MDSPDTSPAQIYKKSYDEYLKPISKLSNLKLDLNPSILGTKAIDLEDDLTKSSKRAQVMSENVYNLSSAKTQESDTNEENEEIQISHRIIKVKTSTLKVIGCEIKRKQTERNIILSKYEKESSNSLTTVEDKGPQVVLMTEESDYNLSTRSFMKVWTLENEQIEIFSDLVSKYYIDIVDNYQGNFEEYVVNNLTIISYFDTLLSSKNPKPLLSQMQKHEIAKFNKKKKTLLLDLDETLVHSDLNGSMHVYDIQLIIKLESSNECRVKVSYRPFLQQFLEYASRNFNVVVFTAGLKEYADLILNNLDPLNQFINLRLYRDCCIEFENLFIKDLRILGLDLKDLIMIDNCIFSFSLNLKNGVLVPSYYSDKNDKELLNLIEYLEQLKSVDDVRNSNEDYFGFETIKNFLSEKLQKEGIFIQNK